MAPEITRYRPPQARVAIAYSTKDRVALTRTTIAPLLEEQDVDLYWFDGSATDPGRQLPAALCEARSAVCEIHHGVVGGPDSAILYMLQTLRRRSYDLVILIENDILVSEGWSAALRAAMSKAEEAGFRVGAASARVFARRVLSFNDDHCLLLNSGAGFMALTPAAIDLVLAHYRTLDGAEFIERYRALTGLDVSATVEFGAQQWLSCDWFFDLILYLHGYVVVSPPITYARNIDVDDLAPASGTKPVLTIEDHLPEVADLIRRPDQIRVPAYSFFRFQRWRASDRLLIACHQLAVADTGGAAPVRAGSTTWRRRWLQALGPFALSGSGRVEVATFSATVGLVVFTGAAPATFSLSSPAGHHVEGVLEPGKVTEIVLDAETFHNGTAVLDVTVGTVNLIGLTATPETLPYYANARPSIDHLPT